MPARLRWPGYLALAIICGSSVVVGEQKPAVEDVLKAAGDYLLQYSQKLGTVVAEEEYTQRDVAAVGSSRRLHSDVVLVGFDKGMVAGYRDVFAVDSRDVRQRDDRLLKLFQTPPSEAAQAQAAAWADEGVRHYMSPNLRTLDMPTVALEFLRQENQAQSAFTLNGVKNENGAQVATLHFKAKDTAQVLPTPEGSTTTGRVWIEAGTGAVRQTELAVSGKNFSFKTTTKYALEPGVGMWLPSEVVLLVDVSASGGGGFSNMGAGGNMGARQSLEGRARYSKYRR